MRGKKGRAESFYECSCPTPDNKTSSDLDTMVDIGLTMTSMILNWASLF